MKKWYVFDRYDCFADYPTAAEAAKFAEERLVADQLGGVHIAHMTEAQFRAYCTDNNLKSAWDAK